jgi:hypothetical protein
MTMRMSEARFAKSFGVLVRQQIEKCELVVGWDLIAN